MTDKKIKIVNWINVIISVVVLILEFMPKSVIKAIRIDGGYITTYHTYFDRPTVWGIWLLPVFIIAVLSIAILIINVIILIITPRSLV